MSESRYGYDKTPKSVEEALPAIRAQLAAMTDEFYHGGLDGVMLTPEFGADLCQRLLSLERMVAELRYAVVTLANEVRDGAA